MFSNGAIFSLDLVPQYLTFKICYAKFPVTFSIDEYSTHNKE